MPVNSGEELLANELRHIHGAEKLLSRSLPKFEKLGSSESLQDNSSSDSKKDAK
jgi:ferritin-like metal-binding protein YciE